MPDITFEKLDAIPEGLREAAKQVDGKYVVDVVPHAKLKEFRDNNIAARQELDAAKNKLAKLQPIVGDDPDKFATDFTEMRDLAQQVKDGKLKGTDAVEKVVNERVKAKEDALNAQIKDLSTKFAAAQAEAGEWKGQYQKQTLHQAVTSAVLGKDSPVNPEALPDILSRAERMFVVEANGAIVAKTKEGATVYSQKDGSTPLSPAEWLTGLVKEASYLGKHSAGGGANGGTGKDVSYGGMSQEAFMKLPPTERMAKYREAQGRK